MGKVTLEIKTEKPVSVAAYLDEIVRQMRKNHYFSIQAFEVKKEESPQ
jgi:hypothetical protein